ncbi:MAG: magnetosome biogenesis CDF transporter MamB [Nitrospinae bacterium]|nr:magnetosome biogenesis CDF transporter MamB [Nitrospinota bacterium]
MKYEHCAQCRDEVVWYAFFANIGQAAFKMTLGVISGSAALIADGFHSSADVIASAVTMVSLRISNKPADEQHPYGHGHIQFISSAIVGLILVSGAILLLVGSIKNIVSGSLEAPSRIALLGAIISVTLNEIMYRYQSCVGKENNSPAIIANAWDNRSDAFSSVAVAIGIVFATMGFPIADPLAAIGVSLVVIKVGGELIIEAIDGLMDASPEIEELKDIYQIATAVPGVQGISYLRARQIGEEMNVDLEVSVDGSLKIYEGDLVVDMVRDRIMQESEHVGTVQVYLTPVEMETKKNKKSLLGRMGLS